MNRRINIICNYAAIYGGNFISSILRLYDSIKNDASVIFTFPEEARGRNWISYLKGKELTIFFVKDFCSKKSIRELKKINKEHKINLIYSHFISGLRIKFLYPLKHKIKLVIHVHSDWSAMNKPTLWQRFTQMIENKLIRTDASYIFVSKSLFDSRRVKHKFFVPNALCLERIPCTPFDKKAFMEKNNIVSSDTIFLLFGWAPYIKGLDVAVAAFLMIPKQEQQNCKFIIVHKRGDGLLICLDYLKKKLRSDSFMNNKNIIFVKPVEDVFGLYDISDVFISASRSEGFSYSLAEAIHFNMDCLVSDIDGTSWSRKYANCSYYHFDDCVELSELFKTKIGFKKTKTTNSEIDNDYGIVNWTNTLIEILFSM